MLRVEGGSFKDPAGQVYQLMRDTREVSIVRGLNSAAAAIMRRLLAEPFFGGLVDDGSVVGSRMLEAEHPSARLVMEEGWSAAVEHEVVRFVTWPYEWPFSMLKDAALLQLRILEAGGRNGYLLKDATAFNVQWMGTRPVFIDMPSFVPWAEEAYWRGYRQFCATFLTPLLVTAHLGIPYQPLLRSRLEGIPPEEAARHFRGLSRFKRGVLPHVLFPAKAERAVSATDRRAAHRRQPKTMLFALWDSLRRLIGGLSSAPARSAWAQYATNHPYNTVDLQRKRNFVLRHTAALRPAVTWDLGANTGEFARIAAEHSGLVVAVDSDHDAVDGLYRDLRRGGPQNVIPLVMDVANPSPGQGWAGRERLAFDARRGPDMVLCLALVHHVRVVANIPLRLFVDWLRSLDATCILEFVGRNDEMFQSLLANKRNDYADYSAENFESEVRRCFVVRDRLKLKGGLRELFLLEPAP